MIADTQSLSLTGHTDVLAALKNASKKTGLDFDFLLHTAMRESNLDVQAKSKASSASGLFQFVEHTWLGLVKQYGQRYGLGSYANAIDQGKDGRYAVASPQTKSAILALRQNPEVAALMAGEAAKQSKQSLECALGREVCGGELYAAHFLGPSGARHLIELKERNPNLQADAAFPQAAKANKSAFYHSDGTAKTVGELYAWAVGQPDAQTPAKAPAQPMSPPPVQIAANPASERTAAIYAFTVPERIEITAPRDATSEEASDSGESAPPPPSSPAASPVLSPATAPFPLQGIPQAPVLLTPGVLQILATLSPAPAARAA